MRFILFNKKLAILIYTPNLFYIFQKYYFSANHFWNVNFLHKYVFSSFKFEYFCFFSLKFIYFSS